MANNAGILVGADRKIEWLLDFWWSCYQKHNSAPVAFVDFGMSTKARRFCAARGAVIDLQMRAEIAPRSKIDLDVAQKWEKTYGKAIWKQRQSWFKKPFALLQTPFERTVWLDLDCEVLGPLDQMFDFCCQDAALAKETEGHHLQEKQQGQLLDAEIHYNSGVIVYQKNAPLLQLWAQSAGSLNSQFWGDQQLLSRLIFLEQFPIRELEPEYNWRMSQGLNMQALIIHWVGHWGKEYIRKYGGLSGQLN